MAVPVLSFEHVTGKGRRFHLKDISFEMMPGFIYGLIGKNGAGKTTLFQYIMNFRFMISIRRSSNEQAHSSR